MHEQRFVWAFAASTNLYLINWTSCTSVIILTCFQVTNRILFQHITECCLWIRSHCFCGDTVKLCRALTMWGLSLINRQKPVILCSCVLEADTMQSFRDRPVFRLYLLSSQQGVYDDPATNTDHCPIIPHQLIFWSCCVQIKDQRHSDTANTTLTSKQFTLKFGAESDDINRCFPQVCYPQ